jgi:hypothetical protein
LRWLHKVLKGVSVVPHQVEEYDATHPPPAVSLLLSHMYFFLFFLYLNLLVVCRSAGETLMICLLCLWRTTPAWLEKVGAKWEFLGRVALVLQLSSWVFLLVNPSCSIWNTCPILYPGVLGLLGRGRGRMTPLLAHPLPRSLIRRVLKL